MNSWRAWTPRYGADPVRHSRGRVFRSDAVEDALPGPAKGGRDQAKNGHRDAKHLTFASGEPGKRRPRGDVVAADRLRHALSELLDEGQVPASVRTEISDSWRRSVQAGLRPEQFDVPIESTYDHCSIQ